MLKRNERSIPPFLPDQLFYNHCATKSLGPAVVVDLKNQNNTSLLHKGVMICKRFKNAWMSNNLYPENLPLNPWGEAAAK